MWHALAAGWEGEVRVPGDGGNHALREWWHWIWAALFVPGLALAILLSWGGMQKSGWLWAAGAGGLELWDMDNISLRQALGAIQLLEPPACLCGLQRELGHSPVWGEACGKQAKGKCRCSELVSAWWLNHSQVSTPEVCVLGYVSWSTAGSRGFHQLGCARKMLCRYRLHWDGNPLAAVVWLIQGENLNAKRQHLFTSS